MEPEDYQIADEALVAGWLADATLGTTLAGLLTWRGFFGTLAEADENLSQPSTPPADPAAGAYWQLSYLQTPPKALGGNVFARRGAIDLYPQIQPGLVSGDTANTKMLQAVQAIKARLMTLVLALASGVAQVDIEVPMVPLGRTDSGWYEFRQLIPVLLQETA